jgi:hypothetical protein
MKIRSCTLFAVLVVMAASLVQAQIVSPIQVVPVVAKVAGGGDTDWRSDLAITNLADVAAQVGINFYREETANSQSLLIFDRTVTIQPGATLQVEDVLGTWFPAEGNTKGFLLIVSLGALVDEGLGGLAISSRTYNAANPNATYGQGVPGTIISVLIGPGRIVMPGARNDDRFRSNVGVLNGGAQSVDVVITIFDENGNQVAQRTRNVKSLSLGQWSLSSLGVGNLSGGRVDVRLAASALPADPCQYEIDFGLPVGVIMAYLSKVDNATADAEFVMGQVDWSEYEAECGTTPEGDDCR